MILPLSIERAFAMANLVGQKSYNINVFSFRIRNFVTPIIESVRTPARITPYPTGRLFGVAVSQALRALEFKHFEDRFQGAGRTSPRSHSPICSRHSATQARRLCYHRLGVMPPPKARRGVFPSRNVQTPGQAR